MKHFWLGVSILLVFLLLGCWVGFTMDTMHTEVSGLLQQAAQAALAQELDTAVPLARQARAVWQQNWKKTAAVADHSPMDGIDSLFAELEVYAEAGEAPHFAACCAQLAQLVQAMGEAHTFSWWNLL